jgi:hypothetical protein
MSGELAKAISIADFNSRTIGDDIFSEALTFEKRITGSKRGSRILESINAKKWVFDEKVI